MCIRDRLRTGRCRGHTGGSRRTAGDTGVGRARRIVGPMGMRVSSSCVSLASRTAQRWARA
eukprot:1346040-Prymnesium_polylepis.1